MSEQINISVARDFSDAPGGRYISDGKHSGEEFREKHLKPAYGKLQDGESILVDLDDCYGLPVSFLEESFGGLARIYGPDNVAAKVKYICTDNPSKEKDIAEYIRDCEKNRKPSKK